MSSVNSDDNYDPYTVPWVAPSATSPFCTEETVVVQLDIENRITMRRLEWKSQLIEYAIIHHRKNADGTWVEVMCIDTMHIGAVHRHDGAHSKSPAKILRPIVSQSDVQESFSASYEEVYGSYTGLRRDLNDD